MQDCPKFRRAMFAMSGTWQRSPSVDWSGIGDHAPSNGRRKWVTRGIAVIAIVAVSYGCTVWVARSLPSEDNHAYLHEAAFDCAPDEVQSLLDDGWKATDRDEYGGTPILSLAAGGKNNTGEGNCERTLDVLVRAGANAAEVDRRGDTTIATAIATGHPADFVRTLVGLGADPCARPSAWFRETYGVTDLGDTAVIRGDAEMQAFVFEMTSECGAAAAE